MEGTFLHYISAAWWALNQYCRRNCLFSYGMKTSVPRGSWRHLRFLVPWRVKFSLNGDRMESVRTPAVCTLSPYHSLWNWRHGCNLRGEVPTNPQKVNPSSWFVIVLWKLFMTRFLYLLSLLKKEKKRKKGNGCLFNFKQMEK